MSFEYDYQIIAGVLIRSGQVCHSDTDSPQGNKHKNYSPDYLKDAQIEILQLY